VQPRLKIIIVLL